MMRSATLNTRATFSEKAGTVAKAALGAAFVGGVIGPFLFCDSPYQLSLNRNAPLAVTTTTNFSATNTTQGLPAENSFFSIPLDCTHIPNTIAFSALTAAVSVAFFVTALVCLDTAVVYCGKAFTYCGTFLAPQQNPDRSAERPLLDNDQSPVEATVTVEATAPDLNSAVYYVHRPSMS